MSERTYTEREVAAIIERAAERQRHAPPRDDAAGLTLAEIERAGQEAGLDASLIREAASEFDGGILADRPARTSVAERWLDEPFQPEAWEDTVGALRIRFGPTAAWSWSAPPPDTTRVGPGFEWTHSASSGLQTTVTASPRGDRTRVRVVQVDNGFDITTRGEAALVAGFLGLFPALLLGAVLAETLGMGDFVGVAAVLAVMALSVILGGGLMARLASRRRVRRRTRQSNEVQRLAHEVANRLSEGGAPGGPGVEETRPGGARLDLREVELDPSEGVPVPPGRRARA